MPAAVLSVQTTARPSHSIDEEAEIGTPLMEQKEHHLCTKAKIWNAFVSVTSSILGFLGLNILFLCAFSHYFYVTFIKRKYKYRRSSKPAYPVEKPKITTDLRYYMQLIGCELYRYKITTEDGFVIDVNRLVDPSSPDNFNGHQRRPILLLHGLLQSSGAFASGGYKSLAYFLLKNGYDVWLGNNRCGFDPQNMDYSSNDPRMWRWDVRELARYDLPCMINHILATTKYPGKIYLMGHSQGTTEIVMFLANELNVGFEDKVDKCVLLAPAVYGGPMLNTKPFIRMMASISDTWFEILFGVRAFIPVMLTLRDLIYRTAIYGVSSYAMFSYLFDSNDYHWDMSLRRIHFLFAPVYESAQLIKWWLKERKFRTDSPIMDNNEPWFNEQTPALMLVVGGRDTLVNGDMFYNHLESLEPSMSGKYRKVFMPEYNHLDVLWADNIQETVGSEILHFFAGEESS